MSSWPQDATWQIFPQIGTRFAGLMTNVDPSTVPDTACVAGQNTVSFQGDAFGSRPYGLELFPDPNATASVAAGGVRSMKTFRKRDGEQILVDAIGTQILFYDRTSEAFAVLRTGMTSDDFGFAEFNINTDAESRLYMGNGIANSAYWNGSHTNLNGALVGGEATITVTSTTGFTATGTIIIGTTAVTYTGVTATTFTGAVGTPAAATGLAVAQAVVEDAAAPKGNILMAAQNRLFISGVTANPVLVMFSKYGDATSWSTNTVLSSTATSAGAFNLIEGGGGVTAMSQDEVSLYFYKEIIIYKATLSDSLYTLQTLKPFDGRSPASGAVGKRAVFVGGNYTFVVTPDNQIKALQRVETIDFPQLKPISSVIQPTCDDLDFSLVTGICTENFAFFACKSSSAVSKNDVVLVFNLDTGSWDEPIVGWQVGEFAVYNNQDGVGDALMVGDANSPNIWRVTLNTTSDGPYQVFSSYATKQYDFGLPADQKELFDVFIEGYITPGEDLNVQMLVDDNGYSGIFETDLNGTETDITFQTGVENPFGIFPFGVQTFGSDESYISGLVKFRVHLDIDFTPNPFYNIQLLFSASGQNVKWKVLRYGFNVRKCTQPIRTSLQRAWTT